MAVFASIKMSKTSEFLFVHSFRFYSASSVHYYSEVLPTQHCVGVSRRRAIGTASEGLAQVPYVVARAGCEPASLGREATNLPMSHHAPPRPNFFVMLPMSYIQNSRSGCKVNVVSSDSNGNAGSTNSLEIFLRHASLQALDSPVFQLNLPFPGIPTMHVSCNTEVAISVVDFLSHVNVGTWIKPDVYY